MKTQIIFELQRDGGYDRKYTEHAAGELRMVSSLLEQAMCDPSFFLENLKDKSSYGLADDFINIDKEGDISYISYCHNIRAGKRDPNAMPINTQHLIELIEIWESLCDKGYDEIILEKHDDKYTLTGKWLPILPPIVKTKCVLKFESLSVNLKKS